MIKKHKISAIFLLVILAILICIPRNVFALENQEGDSEYFLDVYVEYEKSSQRNIFTVVTDYKDAKKFYIKDTGDKNISGCNYINNFTYSLLHYRFEDGDNVKVVLIDKDNRILLEKKIKIKDPLTYHEDDEHVIITNENENKVIKFNDTSLENIIRKKVGKSSGDIILSDVLKVDCLFLNDGIKDLEGIQYFKNLLYLKIENDDINSIKNIKKLSELPKLVSFNGKIKTKKGNIEFIKNLDNLKYVVIKQSGVEDISALGNLKNLKYVNLVYNNISDISSLKNLKEIEHLALVSNKVKDISSISELPRLKYLDLKYNKISSIEPLHNLDGLDFLYLKGNEIEDYSPVYDYYDNLHHKDFNYRKPKEEEIIEVKDTRLSNRLSRVYDEGKVYKEYVKTIEKLEIDNSTYHNYLDPLYVHNIDGIEYLENVKQIRLIGNKIKNIDKLKDLKKIEELDLSYNRIQDISALKSLTNLKRLLLRGNCIEDITPLKELTKLEYVDLSENYITDISGIEDLTNLKTLDLSYNKITDISKLVDLRKLRTVKLNNNRIKDIQVIENMKNSYTIELKNNSIDDVSVLNEIDGLNTITLANNPIKEYESIPKFYDICELKDLEIIKTSKNKYKFVNKIKDHYALVEAIKNHGYFEIEDEKVKKAYEKAQEIINNLIKDNMTDIEKEIVLHDYVVNNTVYDYENLKNNTIPFDSFTPYGILIKGTGVCDGYANTMLLLLNMAGVDCRYIIGRAGGDSHAWNLVKLDGEYYHLDATWDDPVNMDVFKGKMKGTLRHDYFNLTDEQMGKDHRWNSKIKCNGEKYNFDYYTYCKNNGINIDHYKRIHGIVTISEDLISGKFVETNIKVCAESSETEKYNKEKGFRNYVVAKIPRGKNSAEYSIIVPNDGKQYRVYYEYNRSTSNNNILKGYYSKDGKAVEDERNTLLDLKKDNKFDFNVLKGRVLKVNIKLPEGETAPKGGLELHLYGDLENDDGHYSRVIVIPEGKNSIEASITKLKNKGRLYLKYRIRNEKCPYLREGYYTKGGTTVDESKKTFIDEKTDFIELNINKGNGISGVVELPDNETAPEGGIRVQLNLMKNNIDKEMVGHFQVVIPEGENSVPFTTGLGKERYVISYSIIKNLEYCSNGYYRRNGCSIFYKDRTVIDSNNAENITITLIKGKRLEGTINLPDGDTAVHDIGINISVTTDGGTNNKFDDDFYCHQTACINVGDESGQFVVYIPECKSGYKLKFSIYDDFDEYVQRVYYNGNRMVEKSSEASLLKVDKDMEIHMTLIKK